MASSEVTQNILADAGEALGAARMLVAPYPTYAFEMAHESLRKTLTAFLNAQGLRPTSAVGGHAAVVDAVTAQLRGPLGALCGRIDGMRITRNAIAYGGSAGSITDEQAAEAVSVAADVHRGISRIIDARVVPIWRR